MDPSETYLIEYLQDEFRRHPEARIRVMREDGESGVSVKTDGREFFFPFSWAHAGDFKSVDSLVKKIKG